MSDLDYLHHIRAESSRFAECLATADPAANVPTCPDWTAEDLLWHLTEVQTFWATIVRDRLPDPKSVTEPARPSDSEGLARSFSDATSLLLRELASAPPETLVWTWSDDKTAGFILRRQAHEALIHRVDAELVIDEITDLDPALACDGVDEILRVMFSGVIPPWGSFDVDGSTGAVEAVDRNVAWTVAFGRFTGTHPERGTVYDEDSLIVVDADATGPPGFVLRGPSSSLDRWLWGRGDASDLEVVGDASTYARLAAMVCEGID